MSAGMRHRFEPARLVLGLLLVFVGVGCVLHALGDWDVPVRLLLAVVPAALCLAGFTAAVTFAVRRRVARRSTVTAAGTGAGAVGDGVPGA